MSVGFPIVYLVVVALKTIIVRREVHRLCEPSRDLRSVVIQYPENACRAMLV
jgi:hypothetical protein